MLVDGTLYTHIITFGYGFLCSGGNGLVPLVGKEDEPQEDKFEFDSAGQVVGYISLDQARVVALRYARDNQDFYGGRYARRELAWEEISTEEGEDYYRVRLSFRPAQRFRGHNSCDSAKGGQPGISRWGRQG